MSASSRDHYSPFTDPEGQFSIEAIKRGPQYKKEPARERREKKLFDYLAALTSAFKNNAGRWEENKEDRYFIMLKDTDPHKLAKLAEAAEEIGGFVVRQPLKDRDFPDAAYIADDGQGPTHLRQVLAAADRSHVTERLSKDDAAHAVRRGGPTWLIFDFDKEELVVINKSYARKIVNRSEFR